MSLPGTAKTFMRMTQQACHPEMLLSAAATPTLRSFAVRPTADEVYAREEACGTVPFVVEEMARRRYVRTTR